MKIPNILKFGAKMGSLSVVSVAQDIYRIYETEMEKTNIEAHLPQNMLLLFQHFKQAYESRNVKMIADRISETFYSDRYGTSKQVFLDLMASTFSGIKYGLNPNLRINIYNISENSEYHFSTVIDMQARFKLLWMPTPMHYDTAKLVCEARPEGEHRFWRLTKVLHFTQ